MMDDVRSPRIRALSWGRVEVEGANGAYKDAKLYPGGSCAWDWGETGTRHRPGIQPADVDELLAHGARVVVLSRGMLGALQVSPELLRRLQEEGIGVHVLRTRAAAELYNRLAEREPVGALLHSTC